MTSDLCKEKYPKNLLKSTVHDEWCKLISPINPQTCVLIRCKNLTQFDFSMAAKETYKKNTVVNLWYGDSVSWVINKKQKTILLIMGKDSYYDCVNVWHVKFGNSVTNWMRNLINFASKIIKNKIFRRNLKYCLKC